MNPRFARLSRCVTFLSLVAAPALLLSGAGRESSPAKLCVVLVTLDTTRADRLGCYGRKDAGTPNLDRLAAAGVRFEEAWAAAPITLPSHLTMLTGCYPVTMGVRDNGDTRFDGRTPSLATRFASAGWSTAGVVSAAVLDSVWGANAGFGVYDDGFGGLPERKGAAATDRALEIAAKLPRPFFLWVHYYDAHWKYEPPQSFRDRFPSDPYQGEIAYVDSEVGRLLEALRKSGIDPIVVVAGDHGEGLGDHRERTHGIFTYRSTLHVPLIFSGPGVAAGEVVPGIVSLIDLAPTVADLVGLPPSQQQDGVSLGACVRTGAPSPAPRWISFETMLPFDSFGWVPPRGITDGLHAYIELPKREIYDLAHDPAQATNLYRADDPLCASMKKRFDEIAAQLASVARRGSDAAPSEEERARLASLGYLAGVASRGSTPTLDPKDAVDLADEVDDAKGLHEAGRFVQAIAVADEVLKRNPENVPALSIRGRSLLSLNRYKDAAEAYERILATRPSIAIAHFDLGSCLASLGQVDRAEVEWRKAMELEPHFAEPRASLIASKLARGLTADALRLAKEAIASGAESADLFSEIGLAHASSGDLAAAEGFFEAVLALRANDPEALGNLGRIAYERGRIEEALGRYRAASKAAPSDPRFHELLGGMLENDRNQPAEALAELRAALALEKDPAERKRLDAAIAALEQVIDPSKH